MYLVSALTAVGSSDGISKVAAVAIPVGLPGVVLCWGGGQG